MTAEGAARHLVVDGGFNSESWDEISSPMDLTGSPLRQYRYAPSETQLKHWSLYRDYVWRGNTLLAAIRNPGVNEQTIYLHPDHLGSPRILTDAAGNTIETHVYFPFGQEAYVNPGNGDVLQFTGHERDDYAAGDTVDLDYMHRRYYSLHLGRFMTADPVVRQSLGTSDLEPLRLCPGNPVKCTDPRGEFAEGIGQVIGQGIDDWLKCLESGACANEVVNVRGKFDPLTGLQGLGDLLLGRISLSVQAAGPVGGSRGSSAGRVSGQRNSRCYGVPQAPPGVNIRRNVAIVGLVSLFGIDDSTMLIAAASAPNSIWDFKAHYGSQYENFGNFHFGAVSAAAGLPRGIALRGAGAVQMVFSRTKPSWVYSQGPTMVPGWNPPFGDDPRDQQQIELGYFWYANCR